MKHPTSILVAAFGLLLAAAGCGHLDLAPETNSNRVLNGTVSFQGGLPAGSEITVRIVDTPSAEIMRPVANSDLPVVDRPKPLPVELVLGEQTQTLGSPTAEPVPFRIEYQASDDVMRHGVNVDARVSYGGKVRFRTVQAHLMTLASSPFPHEVAVEPVAR